MASLVARSAGAYRQDAKQIVVVHRGTSATERHYLAPRLVACRLPVVHWDIRSGAAAPCLDGAFVIVVRYLDSKACRTLKIAQSRLAGLAWLLDDDIPAAWRSRGLPLRYRYRMSRFWLLFSHAIQNLASEIWLASDVLMKRSNGDRDPGPLYRIDPVPDHGPQPVHPPAQPNEPVVIFYHGEITHMDECLWLRDVLKGVQRQLDQTTIDIIGHETIRGALSDIERCHVRPTMPWSQYRAHIDGSRGDIGLAPLLDSAFNRARSYVKYLEIRRHGGVGVFADGPVYRGTVQHDRNGLLLSMDRQLWIKEIIELVQNDEKRNRMRAASKAPIAASTPPSLSAFLQL